MKRSRTRWRRLLEVTGSVLLVATGLGCVSVTAYDELAAERDRLREENERLQASTQSLERGRVEAVDELEDLRQSKVRLEEELRKVTTRTAELEGELEAQRGALLAAQREKLATVHEGLSRELAPELETGQVRIVQSPDVVRVELDEEVLFAPASSEPRPFGRGVLEKVALELFDAESPVAVDAGPEGAFLRDERAAAMAAVLLRGGIPGERLMGAGSEDDALAPRVEVALAPVPGAVAAPPLADDEAPLGSPLPPRSAAP